MIFTNYIYIDPTIQTAGDGSTPALALKDIPTSNNLVEDTMYIIRRTEYQETLGVQTEGTYCTLPFNTSSITLKKIAFCGLALPTDSNYTDMPAIAIEAWGGDTATHAQIISGNTTSTAQCSINGLEIFILTRVQLSRKHFVSYTDSSFKYLFNLTGVERKSLAIIENCKFLGYCKNFEDTGFVLSNALGTQISTYQNNMTNTRYSSYIFYLAINYFDIVKIENNVIDCISPRDLSSSSYYSISFDAIYIVSTTNTVKINNNHINNYTKKLTSYTAYGARYIDTIILVNNTTSHTSLYYLENFEFTNNTCKGFLYGLVSMAIITKSGCANKGIINNNTFTTVNDPSYTGEKVFSRFGLFNFANIFNSTDSFQELSDPSIGSDSFYLKDLATSNSAGFMISVECKHNNFNFNDYCREKVNYEGCSYFSFMFSLTLQKRRMVYVSYDYNYLYDNEVVEDKGIIENLTIVDNEGLEDNSATFIGRVYIGCCKISNSTIKTYSGYFEHCYINDTIVDEVNENAVGNIYNIFEINYGEFYHNYIKLHKPLKISSPLTMLGYNYCYFKDIQNVYSDGEGTIIPIAKLFTYYYRGSNDTTPNYDQIFVETSNGAYQPDNSLRTTLSSSTTNYKQECCPFICLNHGETGNFLACSRSFVAKSYSAIRTGSEADGSINFRVALIDSTIQYEKMPLQIGGGETSLQITNATNSYGKIQVDIYYVCNNDSTLKNKQINFIFRNKDKVWTSDGDGVTIIDDSVWESAGTAITKYKTSVFIDMGVIALEDREPLTCEINYFSQKVGDYIILDHDFKITR